MKNTNELNYKSDKSLVDSSDDEELENHGRGFFGGGIIIFKFLFRKYKIWPIPKC